VTGQPVPPHNTWFYKIFGQNGIVGAVAAAAVLVGTVGGFTGFAIGRGGDNNSPGGSAASLSGATASQEPSAAPRLKFNRQTDSVPWCAQYAGSGVVPPGHALLFFDRDASAPSSPLYFDGRATPTANGWSSAEIYLGEKGDEGLRVSLLAFLVTEDQAKFIESIQLFPLAADKPTNAAWKSGNPPGSLADEWTVERTADLGSCGR
jgi:hypothetical protein